MTPAAVVTTRCDDDSAYEDGSDVTIRSVSSSSDRSPFAEFRARGWPARLADLTSSADVRDVRTPERPEHTFDSPGDCSGRCASTGGELELLRLSSADQRVRGNVVSLSVRTIPRARSGAPLHAESGRTPIAEIGGARPGHRLPLRRRRDVRRPRLDVPEQSGDAGPVMALAGPFVGGAAAATSTLLAAAAGTRPLMISIRQPNPKEIVDA